LDIAIVIFSIVELILGLSLQNTSSSELLALRAFRLLRIFKLVKSNVTLTNLIESIIYTIGNLGTFSVLLFLMIYVFTLLGMQFFAKSLNFISSTHFVKLTKFNTISPLIDYLPNEN